MNYIIKYKDGSKEIVPEVVADAVLKAASPKIAWTDKNGKKQIDLVMISKLLPVEDYYNQYPEERPHDDLGNVTNKLLSINYGEVKGLSAVNNLIKGLEKFIKYNQSNLNAKILLKKMTFNLERIKNGEKVDINNLIKM